MPRCIAPLYLLTLTAGCTSPTPQPQALLADLPARAAGALASERDALPAPDGIVGEISRVGERSVWAQRSGSSPFTRLLATDGRSTWSVVPDSALSFDRPVLSKDGNLVAFVYAPRGIASIGVAPFRGGQPIQLTNVGMERKKRAPGRAPEGFVPVPDGDSLIFSGGRLEWDTPEGRVSARLPPGLLSAGDGP